MTCLAEPFNEKNSLKAFWHTTDSNFNLHSVTKAVTCLTSSVNVKINSAGCPAKQPMTTSSECDECSASGIEVEAASDNWP